MRTFIISLFIFLSVGQVSTQLEYGPGSKPCSDLVKAWEGGGFFDKNFFDSWVLGFVGGANWVSQQSLYADQTIFGMELLKFCKSKPSAKVVEGVIRVYEELN